MNPETLSTSATEDEAKPDNKEHQHNFFLDRKLQQILLAVSDHDMDIEPITTTAATPTWRLLNNDIHPWNSDQVRRTTVSSTTAETSAGLRTEQPRINCQTRNAVDRQKEIPFNFRHYSDVARYMEQYRLDYTYAQLNISTVLEAQFPETPPPNADSRVLPTTSGKTGKIAACVKRNSTPSVEFQGQRMDSPRRQGQRMDSPRRQGQRMDSPRRQGQRMDSPRRQGQRMDSTRRRDPNPMRNTFSTDRFSMKFRNLEDSKFQTSGPSSKKRFWTFDFNNVLQLVSTTTAGAERTRTVETEADLMTSSDAVSGKAAKHFSATGCALDNHIVKRLSSQVSNLELPVSGLRALDILSYTNHARAGLTQKQSLHVGVSTILPFHR